VLFHRYPRLREELEAISMIIPRRKKRRKNKHNVVESAKQMLTQTPVNAKLFPGRSKNK
jgi:hypothetical protein